MAVSLDIIEREIDRLETKETTYYVCQRLACLYAVRDHMMPSAPESDQYMQSMEGSEFLRACSGVSVGQLMKVLDSHMSALAVVQPREYESVMERIRAL